MQYKRSFTEFRDKPILACAILLRIFERLSGVELHGYAGPGLNGTRLRKSH